MLSALWPLAFAPSTVLHNYISADLLVVGYPWLTLHGTGVSTGHANAEAVDRLRAMKIPHEDHPSKFEFVAEHTNGCLAPHYLCLCAPRFFGDNGTLIAPLNEEGEPNLGAEVNHTLLPTFGPVWTPNSTGCGGTCVASGRHRLGIMAVVPPRSTGP
ncbi:hypothetical protein CERSUDRAFT_101347 [Gelatoporia subvermispora B]|uniref:Uncharacterized protein n=1 Tax=Ceriporiopsis subvermispora (strain B) TaxID=914234 RepID=M2Q0X1_CERS8|nr:hypothetical protein CERSUDRAFT_101347 [Gelatoporia subvermispora B]